VRFSPRLATALLVATGILVARPATAQIVNVQPLIASQQSGADGVSGAVEGSADVRSGNTRLVSLSASGLGEVRRGRHLLFLLARGDFAEKSGDPFVSKDLEHLRYRLTISEPFEAETFVQHDRDAFRRLALRVLVGAGPRLHLQPFGGFEAAVGAAVMLEHERLGGGDEPDAGSENDDFRLSTYLFLSTEIGPRLKLGNTIYVQPRLDRFHDVRVFNELALIARATEHFAVKLTYTSAYDSAPPEGVIPLDTTLKGAIQVNF
jgi:uncharacterized protein DUF481